MESLVGIGEGARDPEDGLDRDNRAAKMATGKRLYRLVLKSLSEG